MKVLHVLNELRLSGAETMLHKAAGVWPADVRCEVLATGAEVGPFAAELRAVGYPVHHLPWRRDLATWWRLWRLFCGFDVVHVHAERANFVYGVLARAAGARVVRTIHNAFDFAGFTRWSRKAQRAVLRLLGVQHVAIGATVALVEQTYYSNPTVLIPNWFDTDRFIPPTPAQRLQARNSLGLTAGVKVLVVIGNCSPIKNHGALIRALATCKQAGWDLQLIHAGSGVDEQGERDLANGLGIEDRVRFLGAVDNVLPMLHAADLFVMPSLKEGFSIAALEALGCGVPAVLTDVYGLRDLRAHSRAVAWAPAPSAQVLADTLQSALSRLEESRSVALSDCVVIHERFNSRAGIRKYVDAYRRVGA